MSAAEAKGINGVVTFDGNEVVIRRRRLYGWSERSMPISRIAAIDLHRPTWNKAGYVHFVTAGTLQVRNAGQAARDQAAVLFSKKQFDGFGRLVDCIRAAMQSGTTSAPALAFQPPSGGDEQGLQVERRASSKRLLVGAVGLFAGLMVLGFIGSMTTTPNPTQPAKAVSAEPQPAGDRATADDRALPHADHAAIASFLATRRQLPSLTAPCDAAIEHAASIKGRFAGYAAAAKAERLCQQSASALLALTHGEAVPPDARRALNEAVHCYGFAYGQRSGAMGHAKKIIDSPDVKPSDVAGFRSELADAGARSQECGNQYAAAELKYGFTGAVFEDGKHLRHLHR